MQTMDTTTSAAVASVVRPMSIPASVTRRLSPVSPSITKEMGNSTRVGTSKMPVKISPTREGILTSRAMTGPPTQMAAKNMMETQRLLCLRGASRLAERASGLHNYYIILVK